MQVLSVLCRDFPLGGNPQKAEDCMSGTIKSVAASALVSIDAVLHRWLPGGKRQGHEYLPTNPTRPDSTPGSFSINLNTGAWSDFATGDKGGDLVSLVAYLENLKQGEAANLLAGFLGIKPKDAVLPKDGISGDRAAPEPKKASTWNCIQPVPDKAPSPPGAHPTHGAPSASWEYRDADGALLCIVYRFDPKNEGARKQYCPLTFCESANGRRREWRWQGLPDPRPLYHLDQLAHRPDACVIVCEGEKAADAAELLFPDAVVVTMLNGAQAPAKTDWKPIAGRIIWLWPDNDAAGLDCMAKVAGLVQKTGSGEVRMIDLSAFARTPGRDDTGAPILKPGKYPSEKWDAADAVAEGWTSEHIRLLKSEGGILTSPPQVKVQPSPSAQTTNEEHPDTRFICNERGVWFFGKNEAGKDAPPIWICSTLKITAVTRDAKNESWGRLLEFDDLDGEHHTWSMPMEMLKGDGTEYRGVLLSMGLQMSTMSKARNLLTQYIQTTPVHQRARCVDRTGWHNGVFVMPDRTTGEAGERILFQSSSNSPSQFKLKGKLSNWREHVAELCAGNSRLVFAVSSAFAAPMLEISGLESGGFHFRGDSSTGKTTALRVAASVWGGPAYLQRWRATDNGLEALAAQHSDCLLALDEISQVDPRAAGEVAYMLANGSGKARANRTGSMRDTASWRLLFLSSGEAGLAEHMAQANRKTKAGMEIRLLDIPADAGAGFGMFEDLHHFAGGAVFSRAMAEAVAKFHGTAALAFLQKLVHQPRDWTANAIKRGQREFRSEFVPVDAGGQVERSAMRFALVATAGELATAWDITGWRSGDAMTAAASCFKAWLSQRGSTGNLEEQQMLGQVRRFFELHGEARFSDWERPASDTSQHPPRTINRAGYRKHTDAKDASGNKIYLEGFDRDGMERTAKETEYFVFPETFKGEVCQGFDYRAVCKLLIRFGALSTEGKGFTRKERLPGGEGHMHVFRITPKLWGDGEVPENPEAFKQAA
jgi:putative DNA primase/helicase